VADPDEPMRRNEGVPVGEVVSWHLADGRAEPDPSTPLVGVQLLDSRVGLTNGWGHQLVTRAKTGRPYNRMITRNNSRVGLRPDTWPGLWQQPCRADRSCAARSTTPTTTLPPRCRPLHTSDNRVLRHGLCPRATGAAPCSRGRQCPASRPTTRPTSAPMFDQLRPTRTRPHRAWMPRCDRAVWDGRS